MSFGQCAGFNIASPFGERQANSLKSFSIRLRKAIARKGERTSLPSLLRTTSTTNLPRAKYRRVLVNCVNKLVALSVIETSPLGRINCGFLEFSADMLGAGSPGGTPLNSCSSLFANAGSDLV